MSVLFYLALAVGCGVLFHKIMKGILSPSLVSATAAALIFHVIGFMLEGKLDSMVAISFVTTFIIGFMIALGIGAAMRRAGKKT